MKNNIHIPGLAAIAALATAMTGHHLIRGSKIRKRMKRNFKSKYLPHQNVRQQQRYARQITNKQLDYTASGQDLKS